MNDATQSDMEPRRRIALWPLVLGSALTICSIILTVRSASHSDSLTVVDVTICADEGLISLQIPLVRLARAEQATTDWTTYVRGATSWEAGAGGKTTLRHWMSMLDAVGCRGGMVAGFGYWMGSWQSDARPGPFIVMFVPVWAAMAAIFTLVAVLVWRRVQFRLRSLLVCTALVAALVWLLTLRAAA